MLPYIQPPPHSNTLPQVKQELDAVATILGKKRYLFGDDPTVADTALFGVLDQIVNNYDDMGGLRSHARSHGNLVSYINRFHTDVFGKQ